MLTTIGIIIIIIIAIFILKKILKTSDKTQNQIFDWITKIAIILGAIAIIVIVGAEIIVLMR